MKRKNKIIALILFSLIFNLASPLFAADTTAAPYEDDEFPVFLQDLRRFEIITLGAMPFVTLDTSLAYSSYRYVKNDFSSDYVPSLFGSSSFDSDEQIGIVLTALGISVGIGITDYIIRLIKRSSSRKSTKLNDESVRIIPISQDPDAQLIQSPESTDEIEEVPEVEE
ncbi:MAG: hypothetical protein K5681_04990 [Treponema sp.]|nr:hypothetical protein [Treponema sp.]